MTDVKTLNDNLRKHLIGGKIVLTQGIEAKTYEEIERQAHALKGVAANLGFDQLSQHANQIVQLVRQRPEGYRDMIKQEWEQLKAVYQKVLDAINCCKQ